MAIIFDLSWFQILFTVIGLFVLRVVWKYVKLWIYLQSLKKKGGVVYFNPPLGLGKKFADDEKNGDAYAWFKETVQKNPDLRLLASHFADTPFVFIVDPVLIKAFLTDTSKSVKASILSPLKLIMREGLLFSHGNQWKKHRKSISTIFRYDFITSQFPTIVKTARHIFTREIEAQKGKHIHILDLYQMITGELVFRIFFGEDLEGAAIDGVPPTSYLAEILELGGVICRSPDNILFGEKGVKLGISKRSRDFLQKSKRFVNFCKEMIANKKKKLEEGGGKGGKGGSDLLTLMLQDQKQNKGTPDEFTDEEILYEFITFFFAGMDTTGHMIAMATYFLAKQSEEVQRAVMKEANELSQAGVDITSELLNKCEIIHAFLKETLRLASPAMFLLPREVTEGHSIEDLTLMKGTMVNTAFITNNYNPRLYKDPYKFNMNRWIQGHPDFDEGVNKNPFNFTPFSAGPRNCIGQHLAIIEGKIIWSIFLSTYNFTIPANYEMKYKFGTLYEPKDILYLDIEKKE